MSVVEMADFYISRSKERLLLLSEQMICKEGREQLCRIMNRCGNVMDKIQIAIRDIRSGNDNAFIPNSVLSLSPRSKYRNIKQIREKRFEETHAMEMEEIQSVLQDIMLQAKTDSLFEKQLDIVITILLGKMTYYKIKQTDAIPIPNTSARTKFTRSPYVAIKMK
jgi:hypothetical protein